MKIVVLDDVELSEKHISRLKSIGSLTIFSGSPSSEEEIVKRAEDAEVIILGWTNLTDRVLSRLTALKHISIWATGYDYVDIAEATRRGITVTNVPAYARNAVAELAVGLMLAVIRNIPRADMDFRSTKSNNWGIFQGTELSGKTIGIIGTGAIGSKVAQIANGFDMKLLAYDVYEKQDLQDKFNLKYVSLEELLKESDVITLHLGLMPSTTNLISGREFELMKENAVIINTARSGLVDQDAMYAALRDRRILGAGLDEIDLSVPSGDEIVKLDNVVLTPHMGFNTKEAKITKTDICVENVWNIINSKPTNLVNPESIK